MGAGATGTGTELIAHVFGGDLTISAPLNTAIVNIAQGGPGRLILSGARAASLTTIGIAGTLELDGASTAITGAISGPGALVANLNSGQTLTLSATTSTFVGGVTLGANTSLTIGNSSTLVGGAVTQGPLGLGPLTIGGGANASTSILAANRTIHNDLVINGDFAFSAITGGGNLTVDPQSRGGFGSIQINGARTIAILGNTLQLNGPITGGGTPSLALKGAGTLFLNNTTPTASTFGDLTIGDTASQPTGAQGTSVLVYNQNALGTGAVTINYGGSLNINMGASPTNSANNFTVNAGGFMQYRDGNLDTSITPTGLTTLRSLSGIGWYAGGLSTFSYYNYTVGSTLAVPTAGAVSFYGKGPGNYPAVINVTGAYPSLTGTMVLGGHSIPGETSNANKVIFSGVTTLSSVDGVARTFGFNDQGGSNGRNGLMLLLGGVALNADLTVKGSGNGSVVAGNYPVGLGSELGSLTSSGATGNHALTVAMSPVGVATVAGPAPLAGNPGVNAVTVTSGYLGIDAGNVTSNGKVFASAANISLNGGGIAVGGGVQQTSPNVTIQDNIAVGANGGTILATSSNMGNTYLTLSGQITGSAPLTLIAGRQGNVGQNQGSTLSLSGNNAGYSGNITLARTGGWGGFLFHGGALGTNNPIGTGTVTAPNGTGFGFNNLVSAVALMPKFVSGTETVLDAVNLTGATINLSNTGTNALNFSGRLGNSLAAPGNLSFNSTVITPYDATGYRFAGAYSSYTITFGTANILKDGVGPAIAYPVDLSRVANAPGQVAAVASSLYSITAAQNFSGAFTMDGGGPAATTYNATMCLYDNNHFTPGNMAATIGAGGDFANTSSVNLKFTDQLVLSGLTGKISSTAGGAGLPVTVQGGSILTIGDSTATNNDGVGGINRLGGATAKLTLGGTYGGGILQVAYGSAAGNPSQTLGSLTIGTGQSAISTLNTAAGTLGLTVSSGAVTRSGGFGTTLYLPFPTTQFTGVTLTGAGSTGGLAVNGWTYVPGNAGAVTSANFAAVNGSSQLVAISPTVNNINTAGADFVNSASGTYTLTANNTVNTMTLNTATAVALGTNILTVAKGGIIANLTGAAISGTSPGGLTSGYNHELIVNSVPTGTLTISAPILQDSGSNNIDLTKLGGSSTVANSLILSSGSNNLGNVWISGGSVRVQTGVGSLGVGSTSGNTITLEGGALYIDLTGSQTFNQALVAMPRGAYSYNQGTAQLNAIQQVTAGQVTTFTGPVTLNGIMQVPAVAGTTVVLNGTVSGPGALLNGTANSMSRSTLVLGGSNAGFSGGVAVYQGAHLRLENAATPAGTGALVGLTTTSYAAQNAALYFGTGAAGISLANDVVNLQTLANWNTGSSQTAAGTVETFAGNVATTTGLTFQGNATSTSAISETVLAGKVSVNGIPQAYNWSTTPTTSMQNFLNGQGGINLGVTRYSGFTLLNNNTASASALAIDAPGVSGTIFGNGALGFVRFGGANSFLPGSVGPGYLAALAKAGAGSNGMFGYLLSGGAANGGSTYTLPEGKGFVIGSLGSGTQVAGVLGATGGTATLLGGPKAATGQTLTGFYGGDVNIHANGATDTQTLNLLARAAGDTLVLGDATHPVVFTPTYGDSGTTSAITFMAKRTGGTTLAALGAGTVDVTSTQYTNTDGTDARPGITWNVSAGTLRYTQNDGAAAKYAGTIVQGTGRLDVNGTLASDVTVLTGAVLGGTGAITAGLPADLVTVQSGGNIAPGSSPGIFTLANSTPGWNALNLQASSIYQWDLIAETTAGAGTNFDQIAITAGNLTVDPLAQLLPSFSGSTTGPVIDTFWNLPHRWANIINVTGGGTVTGTSLLIDNSAWVTLGSFTTAPAQTGSGIDLLWSSFVPEPTALVLLAAAATLGFARRRR